MTTQKKEAYFYRRSDKGVECTLCPHSCNLKDGQAGLCHSRVNHGGVLYAETYSRACALNVDPIEKKPLFHFLPGTDCISVATTGCNMACKNCQNANISQAAPSDVKSLELSPEALVEACIETKCPTIAYTYTEPLTYYEYTFDTAIIARERGLRNVIVSAGYINEAPLRQLIPYLDAANIDLKSFDDALYHKLNRASLQPVLDTLKVLKDEGVWLEITNLLIPTLNDSDDKLKEMCDWLAINGFENTPLHFSRFFPMFRLENIPATPAETLMKAYDMAKAAGLKYVYVGNSPEIDGENTYCPHCNFLLIRREGFNVIANDLKEGHCPNCGTLIAGVWK